MIMSLYHVLCCFGGSGIDDEPSERITVQRSGQRAGYGGSNTRQGDRYTVVISTTYDDTEGKVVRDTQKLAFGTHAAAEQYAKQWIGKPNIHVEIQGPPIPSKI